MARGDFNIRDLATAGDYDESRDPIRLGQGTCWRETDRAVMVKLDDEDEERWLPKSVLHDDSEVYSDGDRGEVVIVRWWAEKHGLA